MLAKRIIPCLDVDKGRVVKGINFVNLRDAGDPVEQAKFYDQELADELIFLDITASSDGRDLMFNVASRTSEEVFIPFTVGGGIRNIQDIRKMLKAGADKVSINTSAIKNPNLIKESASRFGSQCIVVAIDAKKVPNKESWEVYTHGGRVPTGMDAEEWAVTVEEKGAGEILLTSMDRDGTKDGYDMDLTYRISRAVSIPVIASGGCGSIEDIYHVFKYAEADAALAASIFHFREHSIMQTKHFLKEKNIPVRL